MLTIFKYSFLIQDEFSITMHQYSQILTVQLQYGKPCIWAMVDTNQPAEQRNFTIKGTGHKIEITEKLKYIGTIQEVEGLLIWHLFERVK